MNWWTWRELGGYYGETRRELEENYIGGRTTKEQGRNKERPRRELGAGTTRRGEGAPVYLTELEAACQIPNHQLYDCYSDIEETHRSVLSNMIHR